MTDRGGFPSLSCILWLFQPFNLTYTFSAKLCVSFCHLIIAAAKLATVAAQESREEGTNALSINIDVFKAE